MPKANKPPSFLKNTQAKNPSIDNVIQQMQTKFETEMRRRDMVNIPIATMMGGDTVFDLLYNDYVLPIEAATTEDEKYLLMGSLVTRITQEHERISTNRSLTQAELDERKAAAERLHAELQAQKEREIEAAVKAEKENKS